MKALVLLLALASFSYAQMYSSVSDGRYSFGQYDTRSGFFSGRSGDGSAYFGTYSPKTGFHSGYSNGRYYLGYGPSFLP
jgi:hypothetical protein